MDNGNDYRAQLTRARAAFDMDQNLQAHFCRSAVAAVAQPAQSPHDSAIKVGTVQALLIQFTKYPADGPTIKRSDRLTWH